jgi:DNA (cytosine-5)-methyltransferase 1
VLNVRQATEILIANGLVTDADGTRRFIRLGEILAEKTSNQMGYQIDPKALEAFVWVKKSSVSDIVSRLLDNSRHNEFSYNVASFFAGIGGFDLGVERAGMKVVFQCEKDRFCQQVLNKHWPDIPCHGDINRVNPEDIPDANVWCGGFPCQDVSLANQGKRKGMKGERSGLFFKYAELVEARRPEWIILENVPGLLNSNSGEDFRTLVETLDEFGYGISWRVLDAKYFGTPQRRRRVYIVGSLGDMRSAGVLFEPGATPIASKQGEGKRQESSRGSGGRVQNANVYSIQHASIGRKSSSGPQAKGYRCDGETYTLDSRGSSDAVCSPNDGFGVRKAPGISRELDSNRLRALGNAVCVPIVEWIAKRIISVDASKGLHSQPQVQTFQYYQVK